MLMPAAAWLSLAVGRQSAEREHTPVSHALGRHKEIANGKISSTSRTNVAVVSCPASKGPSRSRMTLGRAHEGEQAHRPPRRKKARF